MPFAFAAVLVAAAAAAAVVLVARICHCRYDFLSTTFCSLLVLAVCFLVNVPI